MEYLNLKILNNHNYSEAWVFSGNIEHCMIYINRTNLEDHNWEQINIFAARYGKS